MTNELHAADGSPEGPLPTELPTDLEHVTTPRDLRAERLAASLVGRTGHRSPRAVATRLATITEAHHRQEISTMHYGHDIPLDFSTQHSMRRVHEAHRYYEQTGNVISTIWLKPTSAA